MWVKDKAQNGQSLDDGECVVCDGVTGLITKADACITTFGCFDKDSKATSLVLKTTKSKHTDSSDVLSQKENKTDTKHAPKKKDPADANTL